MSQFDEFIPRHLNEHPPAFRGCSWPEVKMALRQSIFGGLAFAAVLTVIIQIWLFFFVFAMVGIFAMFMWRIKQIVKEKRGKPVGYFDTYMAFNAQKKGKRRSFVALKNTPWEVTKT